jgi:GT2 family glycosyltransferase
MEPEPTTPPRFTVSLVTYRGARWLPGCLASLAAQTEADYELLVLDNASDDATAALCAEAAADDRRIALERCATNLGYAAGHNRLIARARGEFVVLLNQDIELAPTFLAEIVTVFESHPDAASIQGRVLRLLGPGLRSETIDTCGLQMHRDRRVVSRGQGRPDGSEFEQEEEVFGADGPVPAYRRTALRAAHVPASRGGWEVLDEDFFMYKEDVDLAWRLRRLGWSAVYAPRAVAWHARSAGGPGATSMLGIARTNWSISPWIKRVSWRNQRLMQLKNDSAAAYLRDLPWIARREVLSWWFILAADPRRAVAALELAAMLPRTRRKRRYLIKRFVRPS